MQSNFPGDWVIIGTRGRDADGGVQVFVSREIGFVELEAVRDRHEFTPLGGPRRVYITSTVTTLRIDDVRHFHIVTAPTYPEAWRRVFAIMAAWERDA